MHEARIQARIARQHRIAMEEREARKRIVQRQDRQLQSREVLEQRKLRDYEKQRSVLYVYMLCPVTCLNHVYAIV